MSSLIFNINDQSLEIKINRISQEYKKILMSEESNLEEAHYFHIKTIINKLLNDSTVS